VAQWGIAYLLTFVRYVEGIERVKEGIMKDGDGYGWLKKLLLRGGEVDKIWMLCVVM
jgi:hypothetical protein